MCNRQKERSKTDGATWRKCSGEGEIREKDRRTTEEILKVKEDSMRGEDGLVGGKQIHKGEEGIISSDIEGDSHCRGTRWRFQCSPKRNGENRTSNYSSGGPLGVEAKTKRQQICSKIDTTIWWQRGGLDGRLICFNWSVQSQGVMRKIMTERQMTFSFFS